MNHMGLAAYLQGQYLPSMADMNQTPLTFPVPPTGNVLLMAQATALCSDDDSGNHTVGVVFTLYAPDGTQVASQSAFVKGQHPGHSTVCMTYLTAKGLDAGATPPARITIDTAGGTFGNGGIGGEDYYSIAVVELEEGLEMAQEPPAIREAD